MTNRPGASCIIANIKYRQDKEAVYVEKRAILFAGFEQTRYFSVLRRVEILEHTRS
jgi:hypothetical protein